MLSTDSDPLAPHSLSPAELKALLAVERTGEPFLAFRDEDGALALFATGRDGGPRTIGRRTEMDLSIPWDGQVSGLHAELQGFGGEWTIADDGLSTNGTFVNEQRVIGRRRLHDGDRIRIGQTVLVFRAATPVAVESTIAADDPRALPPLTDTQRRVLVALCRPLRDGGAASPATNQQIAAELFLSVEAVKMHLRTLFTKFELGDLPQNEKRARLAQSVLAFGVISQRELV